MRLIIEDLEGSTTVVNLESEEVTIGRKPHNTIQLTEQNVSRSHARLNFQEDGWQIQDLSSYNGVKVNGVPIGQPTQLRESDLIQIGDYHLTLTDNADRATVDIERPRPAAANDGIVGMSSSANLPSVSVEDLEPMHPAPVAAAPPQEESSNNNKAGMIMGIIGIVLAIIGIGAFIASQGDKDEGEAEPAATTTVGDKTPGPTPPPASTSGEAIPTPPLPEEPTDSGAVDDSASAGQEAVPVPEPVLEPEPEPEPTKKVATKKATKPKLPPDEALKQARQASLQGDNKRAYSLAKDAYSQNKNTDALNLMGVAACKMGSESKAKSAHKKMSSSAKGTLEKICGPLGIQL